MDRLMRQDLNALGDELYKQSPSGVLMRCIPTNQGRQLLLEVHAEICGHHAEKAFC